MERLTAFSNALAVFNYAHWRYPNEIIGLTSNGVTYSVNIQLDCDNFDIKAELECLRDIISAGAEITTFDKRGGSTDAIWVCYRYDK